MFHFLTYRRPPFVQPVTLSALDHANPAKASVPIGIPERLCFERVIAGRTCAPCSTRDFLNYLTYVEYVPENLLFYLWFRDYVKRFSSITDSDKALSPDWRPMQTHVRQAPMAKDSPKEVDCETATLDENASLADFGTGSEKEPAQPNASSATLNSQRSNATWSETFLIGKYPKADYKKLAADAFAAEGITYQPVACQPFREEITRIIGTYIANGATRQLNLSARERGAAIRALASTTHPSALQGVYQIVGQSLRHQAHPNFIRWSVGNANSPRLAISQAFGATYILLGFLGATLLTISRKPRPWRILTAIPLFIGLLVIFSGSHGLCTLMHGLRARHLQPWEVWDDAGDDVGDDDTFSGRTESQARFEARRAKRWSIGRIFDRQVRVEEPGLREIQNGLILQGIVRALVLTIILVGMFCAIPQGYVF